MSVKRRLTGRERARSEAFASMLSASVAGKQKRAATGIIRERAWDAGYFYHVTFARHLPSVAARGLHPEKDGISHGVPFLSKHSAGKVFVSTWLGILFWADSAADIAMEMATKRKVDPCAEGLVPVLLRVPAAMCIAPDLPGWKDSRAEAFATGPIEPGVIELYAGRQTSRWLPVGAYAEIDPSVGCVVEVDSSVPKHFPLPKRDMKRLSTVIVLQGKESPLMPRALPDPQVEFYRR